MKTNKLLLILFAIILAGCQMPSSGFPPDPTPAPPPPPVVQPPPPQKPPSTGDVEFRLIKTVFTWHGNAAHLDWSESGLYLANEEGIMGAIKIVNGKVVAYANRGDYIWSVAAAGRIAAWRSSLNGGISITDSNLAVISTISHQKVTDPGVVGTDGTLVFVPRMGDPGRLEAYKTDGTLAWSANADEAWGPSWPWNVTVRDGRVYVASGTRIQVFSATGTFLASLPFTGEFDVRNSRLVVVHDKYFLDTYDTSDLAAPRLLGRYETEVSFAPWDSTPRRRFLMVPTLSADGNRVYVGFGSENSGSPQGATYVGDWTGGIRVFDISSDVPVLIQTEEIVNPAKNHWSAPVFVALSPDGQKLAAPIWYFGVLFYSVDGDGRLKATGKVATTGEARDVWVDPVTGLLHVYAVDSIQIIDPNTGEHVGVEWDSRKRQESVDGISAGTFPREISVDDYRWVLEKESVRAHKDGVVVFEDLFPGTDHHGYPNIIAHRGRIYAAAGRAGLLIYDATNPRRIAQVRGVTANWVEAFGEYVAVANYWFADEPDGLLLYDLDGKLLARFPRDNNATFRVRVYGNKLYRVALYGVDILEVQR